MRPIVTVIAQLAMILAAAQTQAAPESPAPIHTSKTQFRIPYRYDAEEMRKLDAQEIRLFVSMDGGINWQHVQTVAPATGRFDFIAKGDGEYWFSVRTVDGGGRLFPRGDLNRAGLKVIVDATPPKFEVTVRQQKPGQRGSPRSIVLRPSGGRALWRVRADRGAAGVPKSPADHLGQQATRAGQHHGAVVPLFQ